MRRQLFIRTVVISVTALGFALAGCATRPIDVRTQCLPMKTYSKEQQGELAEALVPLPIDSIVITIVTDYGQMRAANEACIKTSK